MFEFLKRKPQPEDLSKLDVEGIRALLTGPGGQKAAMEVCQRAAQAGSTDAAVFLSTAFMRLIDSGKGDHPGVRESFVKYTEMAAKLGDNGSRYNLAKHHSKLYIEPNGEMSQESYRHLKAAERWHKLAAAEGFQPSIDSLRNIAPVLEWADERFTED